jgi:hypothetical protein
MVIEPDGKLRAELVTVIPARGYHASLFRHAPPREPSG